MATREKKKIRCECGREFANETNFGRHQHSTGHHRLGELPRVAPKPPTGGLEISRVEIDLARDGQASGNGNGTIESLFADKTDEYITALIARHDMIDTSELDSLARRIQVQEIVFELNRLKLGV